MPKQVAHYKCLVISPGDVEDAREAVTEAITGWNAHAGEGLGVKIEAVRWESHTRPEMGAPPQEIINKQIVDDCDFGIAIFWTRLGTPTAKHPSGSVEEIERLVSKGANVLVYFNEAPIPQSALKDKQFQRLQALKDDYRKRSLYSGYNTIDELRRVLPLHINGTMTSLLLQQRAEGQPMPSLGTATAPRPDIRVKVNGALLGRGGPMSAGIVVEVQNHSPNDFFFASLMFGLADGKQLFFQRDAVTGAHLMPRKIERGDSFTFIVDPAELMEALQGQQPTVVVARDKIDRRFQSRDGELAAALKEAMVHVDDLRKR